MKGRKRDYANILIVEGEDDKFSVIGLMRKHVEWPEREPWPVWIEVAGGVEQILAESYLPTELKAANAHNVGVVLDADLNSQGRYQQLRKLCLEQFPQLPAELPTRGLIAQGEYGKRLGVWVMPDNCSKGDLETFLRFLIRPADEFLWEKACSSVSDAIGMGAKCRDTHLPKANLYTWLAWQDPPGQSAGRALTRRILDPQAEYCAPFVSWFRSLFGLDARGNQSPEPS